MKNPDIRAEFRRLTDDLALRRRFEMDGTYPYYNMLKAVHEGRLDTWDIGWYLRVFFQSGLVLYPSKSLVSHIGVHGLHCDNVTEFAVEIGQDKVGDFPATAALNETAYRRHCDCFRQRARRLRLPLWRRWVRRLRAALKV